MLDIPPRRVPLGPTLNSSEEELDAAAEITPEDLAMLTRRAPAAIRPYLEAEPDDEAPDAGPA